jgi:hypothetical protein
MDREFLWSYLERRAYEADEYPIARFDLEHACRTLHESAADVMTALHELCTLPAPNRPRTPAILYAPGEYPGALPRVAPYGHPLQPL